MTDRTRDDYVRRFKQQIDDWNSDMTRWQVKAAQAKDPKLFTEASEQMRAACSKCHLTYAPRRYTRPAASDPRADVP